MNMRGIMSPISSRFNKPKTGPPGKRAEMNTTRNEVAFSELDPLDMIKNNISEKEERNMNASQTSSESADECCANLPTKIEPKKSTM